MTEWKLQSYPEMLQALYQLKAATRIYRQERTAENAALMLEKFPAAAMAAAEDAAAWKRVMSGAAAGVLERAADGADVDKLAALGRNDRFYTLFAHEDAAAFQKFLAEREKNKADIAVLEGGGKADKKAKKPARGSSDAAKPAAKKEDAVVGELRREIEAAVTRDKKLTDTEKRNMLQALAETAEIKAAAKGAKCKLSFGGYAVDTVLAREGIVFEGKFSKYGGLSAETAKTLKNGKYVTTAGLAAKSTRAAENRAAKKQEESNEKLAALRQKEKAYDEALVPAFRKFLQRADAAAVYDDVQNGGGILASVCREPDEAAADFKRELARAAENSREVWGLFRGKGDDHCFDTSSFYEKCLQNTVAEQGISAAEQAAGLFRDYTKGKEGGAVLDMKRLVTKYAMATAGMSLPYEEAKQLLQREVYRMGMALRHSDRFDLEKFNFMNEVLAADGYKIGIQELPVKAKNGREAKPLGEEILKDMHKPNGVKNIKNRTIALLYRVEEFRRAHPGTDLGNPGASPQAERLYNTFMQVFYGREARKNGGLYDNMYEKQWRAFVQNGGNAQKAKDVFDYFNGEAGSRETLQRWIGDLEKGNSVGYASMHHIFYRRFAGAVQDPARQLNAVPRVVATISMHPADADMHKDEEHKFDMKEVYLFRRGKDVLTGSFNNVREGDVLLMPVVMKRQGDGSFRPLMEQGTLLMTSKLTVREPEVQGRSFGIPERDMLADVMRGANGAAYGGR